MGALKQIEQSKPPEGYRPIDYYIRNSSDRMAITQGMYIDYDAAKQVIDFIEALTVQTGRLQGKPFKLLDWQKHDFIVPVFGWKRANGLRRFSEVFSILPKKNGKTVLTAGIALYFLIGNGRNSETYSLASDQQQAALIYTDMERFINANAELKKLCKPVPSTKRVRCEALGSTYRSLSADSKNKDGPNASLIIFDEYHRSGTPELIDVMKYAGIGRDNFMTIKISTAGDDISTPCFTEYQRAKAILQSQYIDTSIYPLIYESDETDDFDDPKTWYKANPSLGLTLSEDEFREAWNRDKAQERTRYNFLQLRLSIWSKGGSHKWVSLREFDQNDKIEYPVEKDIAKGIDGDECFIGIDLSAVRDLTAVSFTFPKKELVLLIYFLPEVALREAKNPAIKHKLKEWIDQGFITLIPGDCIDYDQVFDEILFQSQFFNVQSIGMDPWAAGLIAARLTKAGFNVGYTSQNMATLSPVLKYMEHLIAEKRLKWNGNPVFRWNVGNVRVIQDHKENIFPSKSTSEGRIDGVTATCNALAEYVAREVKNGRDYTPIGCFTINGK